MSDPEDWAFDALVEEQNEQTGKEFFADNWDALLPEKARELICNAASEQRAATRSSARAALTRADACLACDDVAGAYFQVRRSVEGYVGAIFLRPIFDYLSDALGEQVPLFSKPLHAIFRDSFVKEFKRLSIRVIANDTAQSEALIGKLTAFFEKQKYRNDTIHSLFEPNRIDIENLLKEAHCVLDAIDAIVPRKTRPVRICHPDTTHPFHTTDCYQMELVPE